MSPESEPFEAADETMQALHCPLSVEEERIELRGRPSDVVGVITVARAAEPIGAFKTATMNLHETHVGYMQRLSQAKLLTSSIPMDQTLARHLFLGARIAPERTGRIPVRFSVPRTTPPGRYQAVFDIGGVAREADIDILPDEELEISPSAVTIAGRPGEVVSEEMIFSNLGNVPINLDVLGLLVLQEEHQICLSLQQALDQVRKQGGGENAHRVFLDTLVTSVAERKTEFGRVKLDAGPVTLAAGESERLAVAFHLPRDMVGGRNYDSVLEHGPARIGVRIEARGKPVRETKGAAQKA